MTWEWISMGCRKL